MTNLTDDDLAAIRQRAEGATELWAWHEATDETIARWGAHMGQLLYRLPMDSQTRDMEASITAMVDDLGLLLAALDEAREDADRKVASALLQGRDTIDGETGNLAIDMAHYAGRMKIRAAAAESALAEVTAERDEARAAAAESARDAAEGAIEQVRAELASEDVQAVLFGVTGTHPEAYGGVTKDEALECAGEVLTRLRAILDRLAPVTTDATEGEA